jgi:chitinase
VSTSPQLAGAAGTRHIKATAYYYPEKFTERSGLAKPENLDFTKISRVNFASFQLNEGGSIWGTDVNADAQILYGPIDWNPPKDAKKYCHFTSSDSTPACQHHDAEKGLIRSAHSVGTRVYATIGGADLSEPFSAMAATPKSRAEFAKRCAKLISNYNFDGIDIDWRFPKDTLDMANYSLLLSQIREELNTLGTDEGNTYGLTATLPCMPDQIPNIDIFFLDLLLDEFNLLSVDFHGPWENKVGTSAPLYDRKGETGMSVNSCVATYIAAGASIEKINIALPFYGQSYAGAFAIGQEAKCNWAGDCSDTVTWQQDGGTPNYYSVYNKLPGLNVTFDNETLATFAFGANGIVSFDDERSVCLKTEYVIQQELGGVLILGFGDDLLNELSTPLLDAMNLKLLNNGLACDGNAFMESLLRQENIVHQGRDDPIAESTVEDAEVSAIDFLYTDEIKQEFRYTCGFGEGDARRKCSRLGWQEGLEESTCSTGQCPDNQMCFLSLCDVVPTKTIEDVLLESVTVFSKPLPKSKPRRKPPKMTIMSAPTSTKAETVTPDDTTDALLDDGMAFSCGVDFQQAESCGLPCPNGLSDCPPGEFCFWLQCKDEVLAQTSGTTGSRVTVSQYKCGSDRDDALTCGEDCGSSWQCSEGKDCYLVPCPI